MLSAAQEFAKLFRLPAAEAVTYLQERRRLTPTYSWQDLWHEEHAEQFTVSRLTRLDLLQAVQDGITKSVQGDMQRRDWMRDTKKLLKDAGWWGEVNVLDPATGDALSTRFDKPRLKLIFDVNTRVAYNAGYWERAWRNRATHPYVEYLTMDDDKVREGHRRWHKLVLPIDHPFWATHWPPNGFRCRCRVRSMTAAEFERRMKAGEITDIAPDDVTIEWVNKRTGQVSQVPNGVQPGFDYNPGLNRTINTGLQKAVSNKLAAVSKPLANAAMAEGFDVPHHKTLDTVFSEIVGEPLEHVVLLDKNGKELMRQVGSADMVKLSDDVVRHLNGNILIHNHPETISSFSVADVLLAIRHQLQESHVVDRAYHYRIVRPNDATWGPDYWSETMAPLVSRIEKDVVDRVNSAIQDGLISPQHGAAIIDHMIWEEVNAEVNIGYRRVFRNNGEQ